MNILSCGVEGRKDGRMSKTNDVKCKTNGLNPRKDDASDITDGFVIIYFDKTSYKEKFYFITIKYNQIIYNKSKGL